ncbi:GNAT family N-acetyltransferase [Enterococcus sp. LJL120]
MEHNIKNFSELNTFEFYQIVKKRIAIFVVEQDCPYQEVDEVDLVAFHNYFSEDGELIAYNRIYGKEVIHIGRVIVKKDWRGTQLGVELMRAALAFIEENFPGKPVEISAQAHLQNFYGRVGFVTVSEEYLEDNIPHVQMRLAKE